VTRAGRGTATRRERGGVALPASLVVLLVGLVVGAAVAEVARTELMLARSRRALMRGLAAADACLARVASAFPAGWDFAPTLLGPDATGGTADDGVVTAPSGCAARLQPGAGGAVRPFLDVTATVLDGRRRLRALVARAEPPSPAVVWAASAAALGVVSGRLLIDGVDPARPDLPPLAAIATPDDPAAVDAWIAATSGVAIPSPTRHPEFAPVPVLTAMAARFAALGAPTAFAPDVAPPAPSLHAVPGDLVVATAGFGTGLLYVDGRLDIRADFAFNGVVVARGGLSVASGATLTVSGSLWVGAPAFDVRGDAIVRHDRAALDAADGLDRLPRRAIVVGLVDR
jgi:hypothetical protein